MRPHPLFPVLVAGLVALSACSDSTATDAGSASPSDTSTTAPTTTTTSSAPARTSTTTVTETQSAPPAETPDEVEPPVGDDDPTEPEVEDLGDWDTPTSADDASDVESEEPETDESTFDAARAKTCAGRVVRDMKTVDVRLQDGGAVGSGLSLLSGSFDCFEDAGVPAGGDAATHTALVRTLSQFTSDAADLYDVDPTTASAKYAVVKEKTPSLLSSVNAATGADYAVP